MMVGLLAAAQWAHAQKSLTITDALTSGKEEHRYATVTITAKNKIKSGASATYVAGKKIRFTKGFRVEKSSKLHAYIRSSEAANSGQEVNSPMTAKKMLMVYPNPAINRTNISFDFREGKAYHVVLYDQAGKRVLEQQVGVVNKDIDVSALDAGLYMLFLRSEERQVGEFKILVED